MKRQSQPDQNELMIVNTGRPGNEETLGLDQLFLGEDGNIYRIQGLEEEPVNHELSELYLGEDGSLYSLESFSSLGKYETQAEGSFGHFFLGEDGTLYEVI